MGKSANKHLNWQEVDWNLLIARIPGGLYVIERDEDGWSWRADFGFPNVTVGWCDDAAEGKAKAEQHWRERIGAPQPREFSLLPVFQIRRA